MVDKSVILRKLSELETYQKQVQEFSGITLADYKANWKTQRIDASSRTHAIAIAIEQGLVDLELE